MTGDRFYVKTLTLENFRCFEKVELGPFDPHFNLLVGANGSGKSSVLVALANLFRPLALPEWDAAADGRILKSSDVRFQDRMGTDGVLFQKLTAPAGVTASFNINRGAWVAAENFTSEMSRSPKGIWGPQKSRYSKSSQEYLSELTDSAYPLLLCYGTYRRFEHNTVRAFQAKTTFSGQRGVAFEDWADAGATATRLTEWIKDQTLVSLQQEFRERDPNRSLPTPSPLRQLALIQQAVADAVEGANTIEFDAQRKDIVIGFADGARKDFSGMSDGQRALIGLVADIARRACVLNAPFLGARTLLETPGLILIDELDLHLHPRWQRRVVGDLKRIFPNIQFFATTHSPQIIGECRPEEIVLLTPTGQKRPMGSYGMDSNWVLECVMEAEGRDPGVAREITELFDEIEDGKFEEARARIARLRREIGDAPDLVGAESYIWRVEHEDEEAAE